MPIRPISAATDVDDLVIVTFDEIEDSLHAASIALYVCKVNRETADDLWDAIHELLDLWTLLMGIRARHTVTS